MANISEYPPPLGDQRIIALDIARLYGMLLVYYGHAIEQVMYLGNEAAALQYKFIYSFHMPFFFLVAGYVAKPEKLSLPPAAFFKRLAASRLVPYFFFSLVFMVLSMFVPGNFVLADLTSVQGYLAGFARTMLGIPVYNIPMWFLASLVSVEVLHYVAGRYLRTDGGVLAAAVCFYLFGYFLNLKFQFIQFESIFRWNYWFIHQAPVGYAFYLVGILLRRRGVFYENNAHEAGKLRPWALGGGAAACFVVVLLTYNLNTGPFRFFDAVVFMVSGHGNVFWFPCTALVGSAMLLLFARVSGSSRVLAFMGRNILILFILNGVFYHFVNMHFAAWVAQTLPENSLILTLATAVFTVLCITTCLPCILLLNKYLPQVVGRPQLSGPLLPKLL